MKIKKNNRRKLRDKNRQKVDVKQQHLGKFRRSFVRTLGNFYVFILISTTLVVYPTLSKARFTCSIIWFFCLKICILRVWSFVLRKNTLKLTYPSISVEGSLNPESIKPDFWCGCLWMWLSTFDDIDFWLRKKVLTVFNATAPTIALPKCLWANVFLIYSLSSFINQTDK